MRFSRVSRVFIKGFFLFFFVFFFKLAHVYRLEI